MAKRRKALKIVAIMLIVILVAFLVAFFTPFFIMIAGRDGDVHGDPRVMIVLGGMHNGYEMSACLESRMEAALKYIREHEGITVIVSGGFVDDKQMSEAECMAHYLVERGVSESAILKEDRATTTVENIRFSLEMIDEKGLDVSGGVIVVTNDFHFARTRMLFARADDDIDLSTLAAPTPASEKAAIYLREPFAMIFDFLSAKF